MPRESGPLERLDSLTAADVMGERRSAWRRQLCEELEAFLEMLWRSSDRTHPRRGRAETDKDRQVAAKELEADRAWLVAEVCEVLYLCQRLGSAPELSQSWLRQRIRHFLAVMTAIEKARSDVRPVKTADRFV